MTNAPFDVVFLDAGGVLVAPNPRVITERFTAAGFAIDPARVLDAHYQGVRALDEAHAEPEVFDDYHVAFATHLGLDGSSASDAATVLRLLWETSGLWNQPIPGAAEALAALADVGIPIVIVSNADGTVADLLAGTGLLQVGDGPGTSVAGIIDSGTVGVAKPDPRIFELALDVVGATPDRAIHIGDTHQYDVRGARAAGIRPVLIDHLGIRTDVDCERVAHLVDVVELLV